MPGDLLDQGHLSGPVILLKITLEVSIDLQMFEGELLIEFNE